MFLNSIENIFGRLHIINFFAISDWDNIDEKECFGKKSMKIFDLEKRLSRHSVGWISPEFHPWIHPGVQDWNSEPIQPAEWRGAICDWETRVKKKLKRRKKTAHNRSALTTIYLVIFVWLILNFWHIALVF